MSRKERRYKSEGGGSLTRRESQREGKPGDTRVRVTDDVRIARLKPADSYRSYHLIFRVETRLNI